MPNSALPTDRASLLSLQAQIAAQLAETPEYRQETVEVTYYLHDGSDARPANIPDNVRVLYYHAKDGALVLTNSNKLRSWSQVVKYIPVEYSSFRTFARSKSRNAL